MKQKPVNISQKVWDAVSNLDNYFHSHCRLESLKRIVEITEAFVKMPEKNLIITSGGPLEEWLKNRIKEINENEQNNILFLGRISNEELVFVMQNALAGVMIPIDEDAGITQIEFLSCGVPVIASNEGGLLETIEDNKSGFFIDTKNSV